MNRLFLGIMVFISSQAFAASPLKWPTDLASRLNSQTFKSAFCTNPGFQTKTACDALAAKNKDLLNAKVTTARVDGSTVILQDGKRHLEIQRTANPTQFIINHKVIDLSRLRKFEDLNNAISRSIPKVAQTSIWMNTAYAQVEFSNPTDENIIKMQFAAHTIMTSTSDAEICKSVHKFAAICERVLDESSGASLFNHFANKAASGKELTADDKRMFLNQIDDFNYLLYQMGQTLKGFDKRTEVLLNCPSTSGNKERTGADDVLGCADTIHESVTALKDLTKIVKQMGQKTADKLDKLKEETGEIGGKKGGSPSPSPSPKPKGAR